MQSITYSLLYFQSSPKCTHAFPFFNTHWQDTLIDIFKPKYFCGKYVVCSWWASFCQQQTQHTYRYTPFDPSFISSDIKEKFFQSVSHDSSFFVEPKEMIIIINLLYLCPEQLEKGPWKLWNPQSLFANSSVCKDFFFSFKPIGPLLFYTCVKRSTTCANQWKREWITRPSALQKHVVALTLKSSPMTRVNDVMYFHSLVSMWFVTGSVPNQILLTSAA